MLRIVTSLMAGATVLASLGCGGGESASSGEQVSPTPTRGTQRAALTKPVVTKEYAEDLLSEQDPDAPDYRYWDYTFDFGDRKYLARVYTDEPEVAYVDLVGSNGTVMDGVSADGNIDVDDVGALHPQDPVERTNLRTMLRHLSQDGWPKIVIHVLGESGYKPLPLR